MCLQKGRINGFALIELLVVILIIGILAAVALPQYQKAVEKARMAEAIILVRVIASAHQRYYLEYGEYLTKNDMDKLDITIPGSVTKTIPSSIRLLTADWIYSPNSGDATAQYLAEAQRATKGEWAQQYYIYIDQEAPGRIRCFAYNKASALQKQLCASLDENGIL